MKPERFPITSEQMELLLAFEATGNLERLSEVLAKDSSVVSRNLQKLASERPVLAKAGGRWRITPLGRQLNVLSREHLSNLEKLIGNSRAKQTLVRPVIPANSALVAINTQKALHDPSRGRRSNSRAEVNIQKLLQHWRHLRKPIIHIKHVSENPASFFYKDSPGVNFIDGLEPESTELVIEKSKASAFIGTKLEKILLKMKLDALVLVGFTGGECIDATARQSSDLGFRTFVVGDATATFDIVGPSGKVHRAEKVHKATLASLHALFAEVIDTEAVIR